jgi:hypothetical protein
MLGFGFGYNKMLPRLGGDEALAFIAAHEAATGLTMGEVQKLAILGFVDRLKGNGTVNGSDIWSLMIARGSYLFPLTPIDDTTANASAYNLDLISASSVGTFINFVGADFTPNGVIGGTGKKFATGVTTDSYGARNFGYGVYCRTNSRNNSFYEVGNGGGFRCTMALRVLANQFQSRVNDSGFLSVQPNTDSRGFYISQSHPALGGDSYKNGVFINFSALAGNGTNTNSFDFHAYLTLYSTRELSMYLLGLPYLSANEQADLYEAVQWYQTNVITGGRNV